MTKLIKTQNESSYIIDVVKDEQYQFDESILNKLDEEFESA